MVPNSRKVSRNRGRGWCLFYGIAWVGHIAWQRKVTCRPGYMRQNLLWAMNNLNKAINKEGNTSWQRWVWCDSGDWFNIWKSIQVSHHINGFRPQKHMITTDVVKAFDRIPHPFIIKYVSKLGTQEFLKPDKKPSRRDLTTTSCFLTSTSV